MTKKDKLYLKDNVKPVFIKPRLLPYAMKGKIDAELQGLIDTKVLIPIECSEWTSPIVPILKTDGKVRICGDYKVTINPSLQIDRHPIPRIQNLLAKLGGGNPIEKIQVEIQHGFPYGFGMDSM